MAQRKQPEPRFSDELIVQLLEGQEHGDDQLLVELDDDRMTCPAALYTATRLNFNSSIAQNLGCGTDEMPFGEIIHTDAQQMTTVPVVFIACDIARDRHSISWASGNGAGGSVAASFTVYVSGSRIIGEDTL